MQLLDSRQNKCNIAYGCLFMKGYMYVIVILPAAVVYQEYTRQLFN